MSTFSNDNHLLDLYSKWLIFPEQYQEEMAITIDKIIFSTLSKQHLQPIYRRFEDVSDLHQDLRLLCFKALTRIENPTNKRIFNFLKITIEYGLKDKARQVGKRLDREQIEAESLCRFHSQSEPFFHFGDKILNQVATLLASGETKVSICKELNLTKAELNKKIEALRKNYLLKEINEETSI